MRLSLQRLNIFEFRMHQSIDLFLQETFLSAAHLFLCIELNFVSS